jgi:hypothetical protein
MELPTHCPYCWVFIRTLNHELPLWTGIRLFFVYDNSEPNIRDIHQEASHPLNYNGVGQAIGNAEG